MRVYSQDAFNTRTARVRWVSLEKRRCKPPNPRAGQSTAYDLRAANYPMAAPTLGPGWPAERVVVLELPSLDDARTSYADPHTEMTAESTVDCADG
jgi:hypothetical protein